MIEIQDNFLNKKDFNKIVEVFTHNNTPFYLQKSIIEYPKPDNYVQMFHILYENNIKSYLFDLIKPLIDKLKIKKLFKCKINLLFRTDNIVEHGYHIDFTKKPKDSPVVPTPAEAAISPVGFSSTEILTIFSLVVSSVMI